MAKKGGAKEQCLRQAIVNFVIEIGMKASKEEYNKAWTKLWRTIDAIRLFKKEV